MKIFYAIALAILSFSCNQKIEGVVDSDANNFEKLLNSTSNKIILDVRTAEEFAAGHLIDAINIDVNAMDFEKNISNLDKSKSIFVYCKAGTRSAKAANILHQNNFKNIINLNCGYNCWLDANKPTNK